jgi:hypothetical protein
MWRCLKRGVQSGAVGARIAQLCVRHYLIPLTGDADLAGVAKHTSLKMWEL